VIALGSTPSMADTLYVRGVVAAHVEPQISTHALQLEPSPFASAAGAGGAIDDSGVRVNGSTSLTAIIGYEAPSLPWRLSIEAMLGVPSRLRFEATGRLATDSLAPGSVGIPPLGRQLGYAAMTAPILTVLVKPVRWEFLTLFAGLGASMMMVYDERITNSVLTEVGDPKLSIDHAIGGVVQAGLEARIWESFVLRLDAKYIAYRDSHATIDNIQVRTQLPSLPTVDVGSAAMDVSVRLFVFQCGIGADF
jgi:hypothetical protein